MANNIENTKNAMNQAHSKQSGFAILMGLLVLVLGVAFWFGALGNLRSEGVKLTSQNVHIENLERVKDKMLTYALLHPELFGEVGATDTVPGPGYFPCPDTSGNGQSDTNEDCLVDNSLFAIGMVPQRIANREFSFLPSQDNRYWFAVDARYLVVPSPDRSTVTNRVAPLNSQTSSLVDPTGGDCPDFPIEAGETIPATCISPITLDGRSDIVMVLFYAGDPLDQNRDNTIMPGFANARIDQFLEQPPLPTVGNSANFVSVGSDPDTFNDYVIAITRDEWNATMLSRISMDANRDDVIDLCTIANSTTNSPDDERSWFNECGFVPPTSRPNNSCILRNNAGDIDNLEGQGWRSALGC